MDFFGSLRTIEPEEGEGSTTTRAPWAWRLNRPIALHNKYSELEETEGDREAEFVAQEESNVRIQEWASPKRKK
eukprot:4272889-Lingulodinium_polyedra.AAC.1